MNYLDGYVEEVLSEPYYDDYGSGVFRWWVKVSYVCEGIGVYDKHKDDPGWVRIDGESWVLKPMVENVPSGWNSLGCGGRKMYINIEGKGIVVSNNCWCQGDVSDAFKDLMPDNATWATKEEFDKAPVVGYIVEGIGLVFTDREGHEVNA